MHETIPHWPLLSAPSLATPRSVGQSIAPAQLAFLGSLRCFETRCWIARPDFLSHHPIAPVLQLSLVLENPQTLPLHTASPGLRGRPLRLR
jgi:hypothetical protein